MRIAFPSGTVQTRNPQGGNFGLDWSAITQWTDEAQAACDEFSTPLDRVLATVCIESGGDPFAVQRNPTNGDSYGLMQIVAFGVGWAGWHRRFDELKTTPNYHFTDSLLNLRVGCSILRDFHRQYGDWDKASSVFFLGHPKRPGVFWDGQDTVNGNTGEGYRRSLNGLMEEMRVDDWQPVIYDLRTNAHAQRFGLTRAQADTILGKRIVNRGGAQPQAIGLHVQDGWTSGSLKHWLTVSASSTIMVQQDGSILRVINPWDGPWTQGDVNRPDATVADLRRRFGSDPNVWSLTIEAEDGGTWAINAAQERTILWQIRQWQQDYPQLAGSDWAQRIVGHYQINAVTRANCGKYRDRIVSMLGSAPQPPPEPVFEGLPAWLPEDAFRVAFPLADPAGVVTKKVIEVVNATGQVPFFVGKVDVATGRNMWRFEDFCLLNDGARVWREGELA